MKCELNLSSTILLDINLKTRVQFTSGKLPYEKNFVTFENTFYNTKGTFLSFFVKEVLTKTILDHCRLDH